MAKDNHIVPWTLGIGILVIVVLLVGPQLGLFQIEEGECSIAEDCEGMYHITVPGYWVCENSQCKWEQKYREYYDNETQLCIAVYDPVCGVNGGTYTNSCYAGLANVEIACLGECPCSDMCSDGTFFGKCSINKPKYCEEGVLIDNCSLCDCPPFGECQDDGTCKEVVGGCGTVTPGLEDECCQNLGYDYWDETTLSCKYSEEECLFTINEYCIKLWMLILGLIAVFLVIISIKK